MGVVIEARVDGESPGRQRLLGWRGTSSVGWRACEARCQIQVRAAHVRMRLKGGQRRECAAPRVNLSSRMTVAAPGPATSGLAHATMMASAWTIVTGLGTRLLGVVGTLVLTYFIAPDDYGQVTAAVIIVFTANQFSSLSLGTYVLAHPSAGRDVMFHASVLHVGLGFLAFALVLAGGHHLGPWFDAPSIG